MSKAMILDFFKGVFYTLVMFSVTGLFLWVPLYFFPPPSYVAPAIWISAPAIFSGVMYAISK